MHEQRPHTSRHTDTLDCIRLKVGSGENIILYIKVPAQKDAGVNTNNGQNDTPDSDFHLPSLRHRHNEREMYNDITYR